MPSDIGLMSLPQSKARGCLLAACCRRFNTCTRWHCNRFNPKCYKITLSEQTRVIDGWKWDRHRDQLAKDTCGSLQVCVGLNRTEFLLRYKFLEVQWRCRVRSALLLFNR